MSRSRFVRPVFLCTLVLAFPACAREVSEAPARGREGIARSELPGVGPSRAPVGTILLTGFEPFGGGTHNASWEGVRALDGVKVGGVRLRVLQLPVLWGAVLPALRKACARSKPLALFSFGQGHPGAIAFERVGDNERRSIRDNHGKLPPGPAVVSGGPATLESSFPLDEVMVFYRGPTLPLRTSTEAGGYLCEECLYCLETLRREVSWEMDTAFFHVPSLGSAWSVEGRESPCMASDLEAFVRSLVGAWAEWRVQRAR